MIKVVRGVVVNTFLLLREIEQCRAEMIQLSKAHGLSSDVVIRSSEKLDNLLNEYQRLESRHRGTVKYIDK